MPQIYGDGMYRSKQFSFNLTLKVIKINFVTNKNKI